MRSEGLKQNAARILGAKYFIAKAGSKIPNTQTAPGVSRTLETWGHIVVGRQIPSVCPELGPRVWLGEARLIQDLGSPYSSISE